MLSEQGERVNCLLKLDVADDVLEERICGRWTHTASGRSYHIKFKKPKSMQVDEKGQFVPTSMLDDETKEPLVQRKDDTKEALVKRLSEYHSQTVLST